MNFTERTFNFYLNGINFELNVKLITPANVMPMKPVYIINSSLFQLTP